MLLAILAAGCGRAPLAYSLEGRVVRPPVKSSAIMIKNVRGCDVASEFAEIQWRGKTAKVRIHSTQPQDREIEEFRAKLGCFQGEERARVLTSISQRAALPSMTAYYLRFGTLGQAGFIELTSDFRLKAVWPSSSGYEIAYYKIERQGDRVRIASDQTKSGLLEGISNDFGYIRILFWTSLSSANHHSVLLFAPSRSQMDNATKRFQAEPDGSCRMDLGDGVRCIAVPPDAAVNAQLRVKLNGEEAYVGLSGNVRELIGRPDVNDLHVARLFGGKLVPVRFNPEGSEIYQLVLLPGDVITFPKR